MCKAVELFTAVPKLHNCAQAVAAGAGDEALAESMKVCGGGKAPLGRCGALHAALELTPAERKPVGKSNPPLCLILVPNVSASELYWWKNTVNKILRAVAKQFCNGP